MLKVVYDTFGLHYKMALSTRPEEKLGDDAMWDQAEGALQGALDETSLEWEVRQEMIIFAAIAPVMVTAAVWQHCSVCTPISAATWLQPLCHPMLQLIRVP